MAVRDDALQRAASGQQLSFGFGAGHARDDRIDGRAADAGQIARVFGDGRLAAEQVGKFLARVVGAGISQRGDVELEAIEPLLVQRKVNRAVIELNAEFFQVARPR